MAKVMLINVTHAEESRVAIVADGTLVSFEIESCNREHLKGNIYKGVVQRVQPGLEAAFVDIGAERNAFLPLDEICFRHLPQPPPKLSGNGERRRPRIQDVLKPGDQLLVQIVKEQFGSKPPTLTTFYSLPGRFLVLLPGSDEAGISRRIEGADRVRVREMIEKLQPPEGFGIIVRTVVGFDPGLADLQRDLTYLLRLWDSIQQAAAQKPAPALVYREHDLVLRNIRDYFTPDIDEIYIDNEEVFERAREFLRDVMPEKEHVLRLYSGDKPMFSAFNIESQIESIYKRRVPLKSGGYIVIDGTEALTAIDVNSGRAVRGVNQEETAFRTNLEAAVEIARQLRLRDLGGLIVIDFIDMRNPQHISEVEKALRTAMLEDKARHEVGRISHFGLLEASRQRLRPAATATTYVTCSMCDGYGLVRTTESAALVVLRKVHNRVAQGDVAAVKVSAPPEVSMYLLNQKRQDLAQLERRYNTKIVVSPRADLMPHECDIEIRTHTDTVAVTESHPTLRLGGVAIEPGAMARGTLPAPEPRPASQTATVASPKGETEASAIVPDRDVAEQREAPAEAKAGEIEGGEAVAGASKQARKRRRRGRRRGKGRLAAAALQEALTALAAHTSLANRGMTEAAAAVVSVSASPGELQTTAVATSSAMDTGLEETVASVPSADAPSWRQVLQSAPRPEDELATAGSTENTGLEDKTETEQEEVESSGTPSAESTAEVLTEEVALAAEETGRPLRSRQRRRSTRSGRGTASQARTTSKGTRSRATPRKIAVGEPAEPATKTAGNGKRRRTATTAGRTPKKSSQSEAGRRRRRTKTGEAPRDET